MNTAAGVPAENVLNSPQPMDVALAFDQNFVVPFYVVLTSLFLNNIGTRFRFHLIATGVSKTEKEAIQAFVACHHSCLIFYSLESKDLEGLVLPKDKHYTLATYYRLYFPKLMLPAVQRLLYLDTDLVVNAPLHELYYTDMGSCPAAMVRERASTARPELGIYERGGCFNSGVMLINIPAWREQQISERAFAFLKAFPEKIRFADQDALNVVLRNNYVELDRRYNVCYYDVPRRASKKACMDFIKDKVIIHYTLTHKPWNPLGRNRLRFLYFRYLASSPKAKSKRYASFDWTVKNMARFARLRLQEKARDAAPLLTKWRS